MSCEIARRMRETNDPSLAEHLLSCPSCVIRAHARYYDAPAGLERKIRRSLRKEDLVTSPFEWRWLAMAASLLLVASVIWNIVLFRSRVDERQILAANVLSAHVRSLEGTHLLDVPSSDQHNVKPWFNGKLDFAPDVKEVDGFPLLGGRMEYLDGHPAAALIYGRRDHRINVFTWPSAAQTSAVSETVNGYHLKSWHRNGMEFWAVSDLNDAELGQFVALYRAN
jgi:anti-sigma factor RsiW